MSALYGFFQDTSNFGVGYPVIAANSVTFSEADPVYINSSGFLALATTSSAILGFSLDTIGAVTASNQTVGLVCPKYLNADEVLAVYPTSDGSSFTQASVGQYFVLSGVTSGAMTINSTGSATTGQFILLGFGPDSPTVGLGSGGTASNGLFRVAANQGDAPSGA